MTNIHLPDEIHSEVKRFLSVLVQIFPSSLCLSADSVTGYIGLVVFFLAL